jgi:hypothetical protein
MFTLCHVVSVKSKQSKEAENQPIEEGKEIEQHHDRDNIEVELPY